MWGTMIPMNSTVFGAVHFAWFICTSCGFMEPWVEEEKFLDKIRRKLDPR